jgi:hypothetical protein
MYLQQAQENRVHTQGLSLHVSTDTLYKDTFLGKSATFLGGLGGCLIAAGAVVFCILSK